MRGGMKAVRPAESTILFNGECDILLESWLIRCFNSSLYIINKYFISLVVNPSFYFANILILKIKNSENAALKIIKFRKRSADIDSL